jgi:hypothetical protein
MVRQRMDRDDRKRLVSEMVCALVICDDCGHSRQLNSQAMRSATSLGVHTFEDLAQKVRCSECPRQPVHLRNITIKPTWRAGWSTAA